MFIYSLDSEPMQISCRAYIQYNRYTPAGIVHIKSRVNRNGWSNFNMNVIDVLCLFQFLKLVCFSILIRFNYIANNIVCKAIYEVAKSCNLNRQEMVTFY